MFGFVDETTIEVSSGNGGPGSVSFRREKYVPKGGPDGGDGGRGGNVIFLVRRNLRTLSHLRVRRTFRADSGEPGHGRRRHGRDGQDVVISVPPGTIIRDDETGTVINDLREEGKWLFLRGGRGGLGNSHFATARRQVPRFAQPGEEGVTVTLQVELNLIADIGFVGYPNAGKSTLLSVLTNACPRVGDWPFTTKTPNLGVMRAYDHELLLADIPGIIEGASHGSGLGSRFLRHISRTQALLFLIDLSDETALDAFPILSSELSTFAAVLLQKPRLVVGTKLDILGTQERLRRLKENLPKERFLGISAATHEGISELKEAIFEVCR